MPKEEKNKAERTSFGLTNEMKLELETISAKHRISVSELIRKYIDRGMHIEKNKDDIDFIRKQIREELNSVMSGYMNRIIKLLVRIGIMTVSMCFFTSKLLYVLVARYKDKVDYDTLFNDSKKKAAAYLSLRDDEVENAYRKIMNGSDENTSS